MTDFEAGCMEWVERIVTGLQRHLGFDVFLGHWERAVLRGSEAGHRGTKRALKGQAWEPVLSRGLQLGARGQSTADKFPRNSHATLGLESEVWPPGHSCRKEESPFLQLCPR